MNYPELLQWWQTGQGRNAYTVLTTKTGEIEVYLRRNAFDASVMEIARVTTIRGFGGVRVLYGSLTDNIPAIAENVINPELDAFLVKMGWTFAYRDLLDTPTRINPAFMRKFSSYKDARSVSEAIFLP